MERAHARLIEFIRATNKEIEDDISWESRLKLASFCYNNTVHSTTGYTPYYLMFGRKPRLITAVGSPIDLVPDQYLDNFNSNLKHVWDKAKSNIERKKLEAIDRDNRRVLRRKVEEFNVGDYVWLFARVEGNVDKLDDFYKGPYKVLEVRDTNLTIKKRLRSVVVSKSHCKKFVGDINSLRLK